MSSYLLNLAAGSESPQSPSKAISNSPAISTTNNTNNLPRSVSNQKSTASNYFKNKRNDSAVLDDTCAIWRFLSVEENFRPGISGVLSIFVKSATFLETNVTISGNSVFTSLTIRNFSKKTKVIPVENGSVHWNQIKHFPIPVVRNKRHPFNLVQLQVNASAPSDPYSFQEIGSVSFHLHDIIQASPISGIYDIWENNVLVGDLELEITFSYGSYGYGTSCQLKEENHYTEEMVQYSLFPRIIPPRELCEPNTSTLITQATPHPSFIPFKNRTVLSYGKGIEQALETMRGNMYRPSLLESELNLIGRAVHDYYKMDDRMERLLYLYELLHKANNKVEVTCSSSDSDSAAMNSDSIGSRNYTRFANPLLSFKQKKNWAVGGVDGHSKSLNRPLIHSTTTVRPANVMASAVSSSPTTNTAPISALQKAVGGRGGAKGGNTVHPEGEAGAGPGPGDGGIGWGEWLWQSIVSSK